MTMSKSVKGFLAPDGKFFADRWECDRYVYQQKIEALCDTHNVNPENFLSLLNSWHEPIKGYYNADSHCQSKQTNGAEPSFEQPDQPDEPVSQASEDTSYLEGRDKDAPGFLEQSFGSYK